MIQVTVLAPVVPEPSHWSIVVGRPVLCDGGAVAVQVNVPVAPDELHWDSLWPPGPPEPAWLLPGGVAVHANEAGGFKHWLTVATIAAPVGYPVRLLVTEAVQLTVLAPPRPVPLHWVIPVTGSTEVVVPEVHAVAGAQLIVIWARPVGSVGVAAL
jgi:hypothetical protein